MELYVWGPAFGLPSIDAECLAIITFFSQALAKGSFRLVQSSPSAVPTHHLPSLYDDSTKTWTAGFGPILSHLRSHSPSTFADPDRVLSQSQLADATAYSALLTAEAAPLLALSLYVSSANWSAATRPAYSTILPFPLTWTEPVAVRAGMVRRAEHLGMSSLAADAEEEHGASAESSAAESGGWIQVPKSLRKPKGGVRDALTPEQAARIRLDALAAEVLDVLGEIDLAALGQSSLGCLVFGYLALMLVPDLPRPWLRDVMQSRYEKLCQFVNDTRQLKCMSMTALPWSQSNHLSSAGSVGLRFVKGSIHSIPGFGLEWRRWWLRREQRSSLTVDTSGEDYTYDDLVLGAGAGLLVLAANVAFLLYRGLPPLGSPLYRYERPRAGLRGFGAVGAMFNFGLGAHGI